MQTKRLKVLVVDDNRSAADALARVLSKTGDTVQTAYDGGAAKDLIDTFEPDLVLTDLKMEPVDGIEVLRYARSKRPPVEVVVFTAYGAVDVAVEAMHMGARDFLTKPVTVDQVVQRLEDLRTSKGGAGATALPSEQGGTPFVANSEPARRLLSTLKQAAGVPSPVWVEGEMGAGRGHAAVELHRLGDPYKPISVRDIGRDREWPEEGTVILPNVDDLPDDLQRALYRDLQKVPDSVRLVATAGPDARRLVAEGRLRPELYYALAVVVVSVPPLRDRTEDIVPMLEHALSTFARRYGRSRPDIQPRQARILERHGWPGNVRELINVAERAVVMGSEAFEIDSVEASAPGLPNLEPGFSLSTYLESVERRLLEEALRIANGDRTQAGKLLGVERNTLRYKLNKYDLLDR